MARSSFSNSFISSGELQAGSRDKGRRLRGDDIPLRKYTTGEDLPTIVPYSVKFGIGYSRMCRKELRREIECLSAPVIILFLTKG